MPESVLFPYPLPKVVGLTMNPNEAAEVKHVAADSPASRAGFLPGDKIDMLAGNLCLSRRVHICGYGDFQFTADRVKNQATFFSRDAAIGSEGGPVRLVIGRLEN